MRCCNYHVFRHVWIFPLVNFAVCVCCLPELTQFCLKGFFHHGKLFGKTEAKLIGNWKFRMYFFTDSAEMHDACLLEGMPFLHRS